MSLDIALLVDDESLQEWESRAVTHLLTDDEIDASLSLVVVNEKETGSSFQEKLRSFFTAFSLWKCLVVVRLAKTVITGPPWYREQVPIDDVGGASDPPIITCTPQPADGVGNTLPDHVVSALSDVDIAIRFGFGILKGSALTAPTYGILSYHHGDVSEYRGRPAGFYEFIHRESTAGVTVQQLSEELDKGTVLTTTKCDIEDANSLRDVQSRQFDASIPLLTEAVDRLITGPLPEQPVTYGTLYSTPDGSSVIRYCWRRTTKAVHSLLSRLFRK